MESSVYKINKGINKPIEFKGLKGQYIWQMGIGLVVLLVLFAILYIIGLNTLVCLAMIAILGTILFTRVFALSKKYGEHGMLKKFAGRAIPKTIKSYSRRVFMKN